MVRHKGFTLIELLVVIAIIALLLSILTPALNSVKERARRVIDQSNLHQWVLAVGAYTTANDNKLLETVGYNPASTLNRYPNEIYFEQPEPGSSADGMVYAMAFVPYMEGFNSGRLTIEDISNLSGWDDPLAENLLIKGAWTCPANKGENIDDTYDRIMDRGYMRVQYAYYAHVENWARSASHPRDLTAADLSPKRLLMADQIFYWGYYDWPCLYNHGLKSYSWDGWDEYMQLCQIEGPPKITGINKLFGDGHVVWKDRAEFDIENMDLNRATHPENNPRVRGHDSVVATFY